MHSKKLIKGITTEYLCCLALVDIKNASIVAYKILLQSIPNKIKASCFVSGSNDFVTAGIQHICLWKQIGSHLIEYGLPLSMDKGICNTDNMQKSKIMKRESNDVLGLNTDERVRLTLIYTCVLCLNGSILACADDGNIYQYENNEITNQIAGHNGKIMCYDVDKKLEIFLTGSSDNRVIIWKYMTTANTDHLVISKMREIPIESTLGEYSQIQSVCSYKNIFYAGIKNGSIYQGSFADKENGVMEIIPDQGNEITAEKIYSSQNEDMPISMDFEQNRNLLYVLSKEGRFTVWNMRTYTIAYFNDYKLPGKHIHTFKTSNKILLTFEDEFLIVNSATAKYEEVPKSHIKCSKITAVNITANEKFMAVATSAQKTPQILLYYIEGTLELLNTYHNFRSTVNIIDFSIDNYYMYCEEEIGKTSIFEIASKAQNKEVEIEKLEIEIEWMGMGICLDKRLKGALINYKKHAITKIMRVPQKSLIFISDKEGSVN